MKQQVLKLIAFLISSTIITNSFAQEENKLAVINRSAIPASGSSMDETTDIRINSVNTMQTKNLVRTDSVNAKALRAFKKTFKNAIAAVWFAYDKKHKHFLVTFNNEGKKYNALYRKDGYLEWATCKTSGKDLSRENKKVIMYQYFEYAITGVTEIITENITSWTVNLQKGNEVIIIQLADGLTEEIVQYQVEEKKDEIAKKN